MAQDCKLSFEKRIKEIDGRLTSLEAAPRVRDAMTAAGLALPVPPPKRLLLRSASSLWPTIPKAARPRGPGVPRRDGD